ncbi:MAG: DinB family protein [Pirellulaceae bacterium]
MSIFDVMQENYEFNRGRTLALLEEVEKQADPQAALGWRPGDGRAHIGWQLMHIGVTEEIFATERLAPEKPGSFTELWPRFRGGSTPDDDVPTPDQIRRVLADGREHVRDTLSKFGESDLGFIPEALKQRGLTLHNVLHILSWHEAHHQGQAHLTLNLYKAATS